MLRGLAFLFLITMFVVVLSPGGAAIGRKGAIPAQPDGRFVAQVPTPTPGPIYWYHENAPTPSPYPSAWAAINGAFAAGNVYNTGTGGSGSSNGLGVLNTQLCNFLCFGTPGSASPAVFVLGNDVDNINHTSLTILGAPDDCTTHCPGGVPNSVYGITFYENSSYSYFAAVDSLGNLGVYRDVRAGQTVVAGQANTNAYPSPTPGALVSHTGAGTGELLMGDSANYVRCDYGETTTSALTCNAPVTVTGPLMAAKSPTSSTGPVPPCYDYTGTACGSAFHIVKNTTDPGVTTNGQCNPASWCSLNNNSIALSSAAQFTSNTYTCVLSSSSTYQLRLVVNSQSTTGFTIQAYNPTGTIANDTNLHIQYACSGD